MSTELVRRMKALQSKSVGQHRAFIEAQFRFEHQQEFSGKLLDAGYVSVLYDIAFGDRDIDFEETQVVDRAEIDALKKQLAECKRDLKEREAMLKDERVKRAYAEKLLSDLGNLLQRIGGYSGD